MPEPKSDAEKFREITKPLREDRPFADYHPAAKVLIVAVCAILAAIGLALAALVLGLIVAAVVAVWGWIL